MPENTLPEEGIHISLAHASYVTFYFPDDSFNRFWADVVAKREAQRKRLEREVAEIIYRESKPQTPPKHGT